MLEDALLDSLWPGLIAAAILYVSDYALTIVCARLYRSRVAQHLVYEGSLELTPYFQRDINALRVVSPRFVAALTWMTTLLALMWWLDALSGGGIGYLVALGAIIFVECAVHMRHFRNLYLFATGFGPGDIAGRIEYPRPVILRLSAFEFYEFAVLYFLIFLVTGSLLVLGGAVACLVQALKHRQWLRAWRRSRPPVESGLTHPAPVEG